MKKKKKTIWKKLDDIENVYSYNKENLEEEENQKNKL